MGEIGCSINGTLDESKFSEPMPWIGIYVAAASAACFMAMAGDALHGFCYRKFWFPCKFFALNATTLTLIGVAIKLSVDLNTAMPRQEDQLVKLSSTAFICTSIGNFLPSLGTMENQELMMNLVALGILVVTVIVNIGIQLGTGVIYVFWIEHAIMLLLMVILFLIMLSSALTIPATKRYFDLKYDKKYELAKKECSNNINVRIAQKLREDLMRYWMMAHTCNPQFVMGRIATCTASGAFCLLSTLTLAEAMIRCYLMPLSFKFCSGESDYKWSTSLILVTQAIAVVGGTIAPASRWFIAIKFRCPKGTSKTNKPKFVVEKYWIKELHKWKECPLNLTIYGRHGRKLVHNIKNNVLDLCISSQKAMVLLSKSVKLISIFLVGWLLSIIIQCSKKLCSLLKCINTVSYFDERSYSDKRPELDLRHYVLHLEGEEELVDMMMECDRGKPNHWFKMGNKKQPRYIMHLLQKLNSSRGFEGVWEFDSNKVPSLHPEEPPNCWALPVVTLTAIAVAVSDNDFHLVKELVHSIHEGIKYIRVIDNGLDEKRDLINSQKAAEIVWSRVDLHYRWMDVDLRKMAAKEKNPVDIITELSDIAQRKVMELSEKDAIACMRDSPSKWPIKILAANSMYRICQTLLLNSDIKEKQHSKLIFDRLSAMITDIVGACLTNLQYVIPMKCHESTAGEREESVRCAICLLGKTEKIMDILSQQVLPSSELGYMACIDDWRALSRQKDLPCCSSSPTNSNSDSSSAPDFYINIDQEIQAGILR